MKRRKPKSDKKRERNYNDEYNSRRCAGYPASGKNTKTWTAKKERRQNRMDEKDWDADE